jgi:hypothetical protein
MFEKSGTQRAPDRSGRALRPVPDAREAKPGKNTGRGLGKPKAGAKA